MVHTIQLGTILSKRESDAISQNYNILHGNYFNFKDYHQKEWINIEIRKNKEIKEVLWNLTIFVDVVKLLNRSKIEENDRHEVIESINDIIFKLFLFEPTLELYRFDYRFDAIVESSKIRKLLIKLYNKCDKRKAYMNKVDVFNKATKKKNFKTSIRYQNKSKSCNVYDKETERKDKCKVILSYEKSILRFEAQVRRRHILYRKNKYNIADSLENYFTIDMYNDFMEKIVLSSLLGNGDYYNCYHATVIINNSNLKNKEKEELIKFLKITSIKRSIAISKDLYTKYKYDKFIKQLKNLDINPILIPKGEETAKIINPLKAI